MPAYTEEQKERKLAKLLEVEGLPDIDALAEESMFGDRPGAPSICMNEDCNYVCDKEPDSTRGWCDECRTRTMVSGLVLAGLI